MIKVGTRVEMQTHWGHIRGIVTRIYEAYTFRDEEGEVEVPRIANVLVNKTPERWPYSIPEFAPDVSKLKEITKR